MLLRTGQMAHYAVAALAVLALNGCYCMPDKGDAADGSYFHDCWDAAAHNGSGR